jgi:hypothetical protein
VRLDKRSLGERFAAPVSLGWRRSVGDMDFHFWSRDIRFDVVSGIQRRYWWETVLDPTFDYALNSGNAKRSSPGPHVVMEKGVFGLRTECSLRPASSSDTKSLSIKKHKVILSPHILENHDVGLQFGLQLKTEETGTSLQVVVN